MAVPKRIWMLLAIVLSCVAGTVAAVVHDAQQRRQVFAVGSIAAIEAAQIQFNANAYNDGDHDCRGEFGHLGQLSGIEITWGCGILPPTAEDWIRVDILDRGPFVPERRRADEAAPGEPVFYRTMAGCVAASVLPMAFSDTIAAVSLTKGIASRERAAYWAHVTPAMRARINVAESSYRCFIAHRRWSDWELRVCGYQRSGGRFRIATILPDEAAVREAIRISAAEMMAACALHDAQE